MERRAGLLIAGFVTLGLAVVVAMPALADTIASAFLRLPIGAPAAEAVRFFLVHVPTLFFLLIAAVFTVRFLRSYVVPGKIMNMVGRKSLLMGNILASLFGIVTPFCSCGVVPLFIGLVQARVPLGVSLSLLISAPLINEIALVLLLGLFGWKIALAYVGTGLLIAVVSGFVLGNARLEHHIKPWV